MARPKKSRRFESGGRKYSYQPSCAGYSFSLVPDSFTDCGAGRITVHHAHGRTVSRAAAGRRIELNRHAAALVLPEIESRLQASAGRRTIGNHRERCRPCSAYSRLPNVNAAVPWLVTVSDEKDRLPDIWCWVDPAGTVTGIGNGDVAVGIGGNTLRVVQIFFRPAAYSDHDRIGTRQGIPAGRSFQQRPLRPIAQTNSFVHASKFRCPIATS